MKAIADIETTCQTLRALGDDYFIEPSPDIGIAVSTANMHMGCDEHVYCKYCSEDVDCS